MRWIQCVDKMPPDDFDVYIRFKNDQGFFIKDAGIYNKEDNIIYCSDFTITPIGFSKTEWLDESDDSAHTPENSFRAEVAKSVLAALVSKEWSDMDLACEQAVQATDKLIQKLKQ